MKNKIIDDYVLGLLYGDGSLHLKDGINQYLFSTTNKQIADIVKNYFDKNELHYYYALREHNTDEKKNYEMLDVIGTTNKETIDFLRKNYVVESPVEKRIRLNGDFLRGYLETKGTLFEYKSRNSTAWRISFSGTYEDLEYIERFLKEDLKISTSKITHRKEREDMGVVSESYRISIQNRKGVYKILKYIDGDMASGYLKDKIKKFYKFHNDTPYNRKVNVFKHYKSATQYMARELGITINGKKNDIRPNGWRLVYLWNKEGVNIIIFNGYETAYSIVSDMYKKETGYDPPSVE